MTRHLAPLLLIAAAIAPAAPQTETGPSPTFASRTAGLRKIDGFLPLYWDARKGRMWLEIGRFDQEFLYITALSAGVGSNDLGLDRGRENEPVVVQFERFGPKVLLVQSNYAFRATSSDPLERRAETDSFARSTLAGFEIAAEDGSRVLVDATDFLLRDAARIGQELKQAKQGQYHVDEKRSALYLPLTKAFPRNTEVETTLTFEGEPEGKLLQDVAPAPDAITVREHQSFVALPEPGFEPRLQDPRAGFFSVDFMDFSAPVDQPVVKRYATRHRLEKKDPSAALSDPVSPIVYYVDPGAPGPIRAALIEGARWWNQAFEAAGFRNAFQVKELPADADPMDVRYNVIQWVHRSTRGWSYGNSLVDPRTGEIVKGIVSLGSLREHQDYLIFEALLAPHIQAQDDTQPLTDAVYARLRQLAAHEVGHTLGLAHNYIASTQGRASVMDYPGPQIDIRPDNTLDLSNAYAKGIGEWDKVAITWGYSQYPPRTEQKQALDAIVLNAAKRNLTFITDADSRPPGSPHPQAHLWDTGKNSSEELERILKIRQVALDHFGKNNIERGAPWATLEEVLVPLYLLHRYQTEAAAKVLGGLRYTYALRGDGQLISEIVSGPEQRDALAALLKTIDPSTLALPQRILRLIPPRPPGYPRTRETFPSRTGLTFDPISAAESAADLTVSLILNPQRAARLIQYHAEQSDVPSLRSVLDALLKDTWEAPDRTGLEREIARAVDFVVLTRLLELVMNVDSSMEVKAVVSDELDRLKQYLATNAENEDFKYGVALITKLEKDPQSLELPKPAEIPPGQPIGDDEDPAPLALRPAAVSEWRLRLAPLQTPR